jgi:hypothetical protein
MQTQTKQNKPQRRFNKKNQKPSLPVEVLYFDPITKQKIVCEYRHETKQWYGEKDHKLYHPLFAEQTGPEAYRWVPHFIRTLGPVGEKVEINLAEEAAAAESFKAEVA